MPVSGQFAVAVFVLLTTAARAGVVTAHARHLLVGGWATNRFGHSLAFFVWVRVGHVAQAFGLLLDGLGRFQGFVTALDANGQQGAGDVHLDHVQQLAEQLEKSLAAAESVRARNSEKLSTVMKRLEDNCRSCHTRFRDGPQE